METGLKWTVLRLPGMDCADEVERVRSALKQFPGIGSITIDLDSRTATVTHGGRPESCPPGSRRWV